MGGCTRNDFFRLDQQLFTDANPLAFIVQKRVVEFGSCRFAITDAESQRAMRARMEALISSVT